MNAKAQIPPAAQPPNLAADILKRGLTVAIFIVLIAFILFLASGRLNWTWAWVYLAICLVSVLINAAFMLPAHPETIAERARAQQTRDWDKLVGGLYGLAVYFALPLVAGLDERFDWTRGLDIPWQVAGAALLAAGFALSGWAMIENTYFSTAVRIQSERGHTVCSSGPYRFVRHPGYAGFILQALSVPFLLGSAWALIPGLIATALMIVRTSLEDRTLQAELSDYPEYAQKVCYRLVPGIW